MPALPSGEEELRAPESPPARPSANLASRMEDVVFTGGASIAGALVMAVVSSGNGLSMVIGGASMFLFGILRGVFGFRREKRDYERNVRQREESHRAYLAGRRAAWAQVRDTQRETMLQLDPDPQECLGRAERRDVRLFERSPGDPDFLALRVGLGAVPLGLRIKTPGGAGTADPLMGETLALAAEFTSVEGAPIVAPFGELGTGGIAGPRPAAVDVARALLVQLATHHSPDEVKLVVVHPPEEDWSWARWLPHVWSAGRRFIASDAEGARVLLEDLHDLLKRRSLRESEGLPLPVYVVVLASATLAGQEPVVELLQEQGARVGALGLFFGASLRELPRSCRTIVQAGPGEPRLVRARPAVETPYRADSLSVAEADRLARSLAPLRVTAGAATADVPDRATLLDLLGLASFEELDVPGNWRAAQPFRSMAVPVGLQAGGKRMELDLHESRHGPHGLVAGTTGSGKTVFLSSWLALLAARFHPHEVAFVCIDYKGGDLFRGLEDLPHLVGTLTNLERSEVWRCLRALQAENERRMRLFSDASAKSGAPVNKIDQYQELRRGGLEVEPLPKLLIVVDEFAELSKQEPEFLARLVSTARVGRSLGVHLVLATQQPAGIIGDQIESNTRFRIAFKFNKEEDSKAVLKRPDAASLRQPGRAFFQLGENEIFELFQAAFGGAPYAGAVVQEEQPVVRAVYLDGRRQALGAPAAERPRAGTQLQALVARVAAEGVARLPGPWLAPLPARVVLPAAESTGWLRPVVGLLDDPGRSFQGPLVLDLARDGHVAVYGRPGAGSTTLLQTLVVSLARQHGPADLHVYLMDFGGLSLARLRGLPHVGDVVVAGDRDRATRLLRFLLRQVARRKREFAEAGATTLAAYRGTGRAAPAVLLVLDNYAAFAKEHPDEEDLLASLVQEGANLGVYVVLSAGTPSGVKPKISGGIATALALQLADRTEYALAVGRTEGLEPGPVPGRGLVRGKPPLEFQAALPFEGAGEVERSAAADAWMSDLSAAWTGPRPPSVPRVPALVTLQALGSAPAVRGPFTAVPVGLDVDEVEPFRLAPADGPHFLVTGAMGSGKTTFLISWVLSLAASLSPSELDLTLVDFREGLLQPLSRLPHVRSFVDGDDAFTAALERLKGLAQERRTSMKAARMAAGGVLDESAWAATQPTVVLAIDDFEALRQAASALNQEELIHLIKSARGPGIHVVLAGSSDDMGSNTYDALYKAMAAYKTGILLGTRDDNGVFANVRIPPEQGDVPRGQGFFIQRGAAACRFRVALPGEDPAALLGWLDRLEGAQ